MDVNRVNTDISINTASNESRPTNNSGQSRNNAVNGSRPDATPVAPEVSGIPAGVISTQTIAGSVVSGRAERAERADAPTLELEGFENVTAQLNRYLSPFRRQMDIAVHEPTQRVMVTIKDTVEDTVIREIPPEQVLEAFVQALEFNGVLLDERG